MPQYIFSLGGVPELAQAEMYSVLELFGYEYTSGTVRDGFLVIETLVDIDITPFFSRLGGSMYVGKRVASLGKDAATTIATYLVQHQQDGKIRFAVSGIRDSVGIQIKKNIKELGHSARYISVQNMASVVHNNLIERKSHLTVHGGYVYVTLAVHDFEAMAAFDASRPAFDSISGMLPPKLARMMLNLAGAEPNQILLDPFCGSGTVLTEAVQLGISRMVGTDISDKAIADTQTNMTWLLSRTTSTADCRTTQCDVRAITDILLPGSIDFIVTEPFMGAPKKGNEREGTLEHEIKDLETLYYDALQSFSKVLKQNGVVVFSKPRFMYQGAWKTVSWQKGLIDAGFDVVPILPTKEMVLYAREGQLVGREIWKLRKV
jgi:tRNA G10  N-methylase Trm11